MNKVTIVERIQRWFNASNKSLHYDEEFRRVAPFDNEHYVEKPLSLDTSKVVRRNRIWIS